MPAVGQVGEEVNCNVKRRSNFTRRRVLVLCRRFHNNTIHNSDPTGTLTDDLTKLVAEQRQSGLGTALKYRFTLDTIGVVGY